MSWAPIFRGGIVLDLFGGSGALSLEAQAVVASSVMSLIRSREAFRVIQKTLRPWAKKKNVRLLRMDFRCRAYASGRTKASFLIMFFDPPFRMKVIGEIIAF